MFCSVFIFQLYNDVQARRGANDIATDNQKNGSEMECGLAHNSNGLFVPGHHSQNHPGALPVPHHHSKGCNYNPGGYSYPMSHQEGYDYCHGNGVSEIGDLLQDYLGQGKQMSRKTNGARHVVSEEKAFLIISLAYASFSWHLHIWRNKIGLDDMSQEHINYSKLVPSSLLT